MAPKGGTIFLLLIGVCAALVSAGQQSRNTISANQAEAKRMAQKLMMHCKREGFTLPEKTEIVSILLSEQPENIKDFLLEDDPVLSVLQSAMDSVSLLNRNQPQRTDEMTFNYTDLPGILKKLGKASDATQCYLQAFLAPLALAALTNMPDRGMDMDDYKDLFMIAGPALLSLPPERMKLPDVNLQRMKSLFEILREHFDHMQPSQRKVVFKWMVSQITKNMFNCTLASSPSASLANCGRSTQWLTNEVVEMMGLFASLMPPNYVDAIPERELGGLFLNGSLKESLNEVRRLNPRLAQKLSEKIQEIVPMPLLFRNMDMLGKLACFFNMSEALTLPLELSRALLLQLDNCPNPSAKILQKMVAKSVFSESPNTTEALMDMGTSITLMSPKQLARIPAENISAVLSNLGPNVRWSNAQLRALITNQLGKKACKEVSVRELAQLGSLLNSLPNCMLKNMGAQDILNDEGLRNMTSRMKKRQLKAMLQGLAKTMNISSVVGRLPDPLLRRVPLNELKKAKLTFEQVKDRSWTQPQAALLVKQMYKDKTLKYGMLKALLQGITCKIIEEISDDDFEKLLQSMQETPEWLSRTQVSCIAHKFFTLLEQQKPGFFTTPSEGDLISIPTNLFLYLPAAKVANLPLTVCDAFLDMMEMADLGVLADTSPSRAAFADKALQCLTRVRSDSGLSALTAEELARLGQLVCELPSEKLGSLNSDVREAALNALVSCENIPVAHRSGIVKLIKQDLGNPSEWDADMMEMFGPLILLDDSTVNSLPDEAWLKDVLYFLKSYLIEITTALKRKLFSLTLLHTDTDYSLPSPPRETPPEPPLRKGRAARMITGRSGTNLTAVLPTLEMIQELGENNVFWTPAQLKNISVADFTSAVEIFGDISGFDKDQLQALVEKAVEAFGPVANMDDTAVAQIGCIAQGLPNSDLESLSISMDSLDEFEECNWNETQMTHLWTGISSYNNLTAAGLESADLVALDLFVCGLSPSDIEALNPEVFQDAIGSMDGMACSYEVAQQLKDVALEAYGDPSTWTEADVADLGNLVAGLTAEELSSLDPEVFSFMPETAIPLIPAENFAGLSADQLQALGPDNAAMLTDDQLGSLSPSQTNALDQALSGAPMPLTTPGNSAPSVRFQGIWTLVRTLVLLLSGFLLL